MNIDDVVIYKPEGIDGPQYPAIVVEVHGPDCLTIRVPSLTDEVIPHLNYFEDDTNIPAKAKHATRVA